LDNSYDTVKYGQGDGDAGLGATDLINSGSKSGAERSDELVVMGPVRSTRAWWRTSGGQIQVSG